jgi:hypothetical protein
MPVNWFEQYAWLASWLTVALVGCAEGTILWLLVKYLRGFLGGVSRFQMKLIQWKFSQVTSMTKSDMARLKEENPELYRECIERGFDT